ncbi:allantoicase [Rhodococcus aetherivorans]|uniref:Probable allantoicase n=1 Tax=Rhodococcus aetherivorans TaxID=191292 RepID=A0ABQ0YNJ3_9NOCA|nr:allantoicase [Rhodococcus aetherivorans]ETT25883.1 allantoicase [Rhodococcus rhodochrous ATCC 21198]NGP25371.1 allantoicase [Rhodococcus aetherivorans]UGQ41589.1 allantoicase [Rhodococcus aetherivorans]GES38041.1 allantoicase [Rhodococcus aetherivorans]
MTDPAFLQLPDLASRTLAGSVVYANDELFAQRENLVTPEPPAFDTGDFGHKGKVYDGWETRRRREPGHDFAIVRLGVPGVVRGVVIDTAWFTGNYPPFASVDAVETEGYPTPDQLLAAPWQPILDKVALAGDTANTFAVDSEFRWTHLRLNIFPDGGVARLRVHGEPRPDPAFLTGTIDLAALEHGADVVDCSNRFYSSPRNIIAPGRARHMGEGWENARRRDGGNDHVVVRLAGEGHVDHVEIDTSYFVGNAPGWARLIGIPDGAALSDESAWVELVPQTALLPDCRHRFRVDAAVPLRHVRLDVYPDGGIARLRVHGRLTSPAAEI